MSIIIHDCAGQFFEKILHCSRRSSLFIVGQRPLGDNWGSCLTFYTKLSMAYFFTSVQNFIKILSFRQHRYITATGDNVSVLRLNSLIVCLRTQNIKGYWQRRKSINYLNLQIQEVKQWDCQYLSWKNSRRLTFATPQLGLSLQYSCTCILNFSWHFTRNMCINKNHVFVCIWRVWTVL